MTDQLLNRDRFAILTDKWNDFRSVSLISPHTPIVGPGDDGFLWLDIGVDGTQETPILKYYDEPEATWRTASESTDHGALSGLADDDHTQYLLASGARALAGTWDMASQAVTNVNLDSGVIDGVTIGVVTPAAGTFTAIVGTSLTLSGTVDTNILSVNAGGNRKIGLAVGDDAVGVHLRNDTVSHMGIWSDGADLWFGTASSTQSPDNWGTKQITLKSATGYVGIGTTAPKGLVEFSAAGGPILYLNRADTSIGPAINALGAINWSGNDVNGSELGIGARISAFSDGEWGTGTETYPAYLVFYTSPGGGTAVQERMRIDKSGNIGVGVASPLAKLHVDQASATAAIPSLRLNQADVSEQMIYFNTTIGVGNAIEAVGGKSLTTTHFIKVTIPGPLTRYIPVGTIA